ncbi:hypothetical protein C8Q75DRAFT_894144 [Abortiporus biennis]|nr:hypothetical protein C8Q75DRAFT_894144 [Abortiporus biennis]
MSLKRALTEVTPSSFIRPAITCTRSLYRPSLTRWDPTHFNRRNAVRLAGRVASVPVVDAAVLTGVPTFLRDMDDAISTNNVDKLCATVRKFMDHCESSNACFPNRLRKRFETVVLQSLKVLAASGQSHFLKDIDYMLICMQSLGIPITDTVHKSILDGLLEGGEDISVRSWLVDMHAKPGKCKPTLQQWHSFFHRLEKTGNPKFIATCIEQMKESGCLPTLETYSILLDAYFGPMVGVPSIDSIMRVVASMKRHNIPLSPFFLETISDYYIDRSAPHLADQVIKLDSKFVGGEEAEKLVPVLLKRLRCIDLQEKNGKRKARGTISEYQSIGVSPTRDLLIGVVQNCTSIAQLEFWEEAMEIEADTAIYAQLIQNAAANGENPTTIVDMFRHAEDRRIPLSAEMTYPVLRALCYKKFSPPTHEAINEALQIFRRYVEASGDRAGPQDLPLYNTLLRALTSAKDASQYIQIALSLVEELKRRGITMDTMTATSVMVILIRSCKSTQEAQDTYKAMYRLPSGKLVLDSAGYAAVLNAFCQTFIDVDVVSACNIYFDFIRDMRVAGFPVRVEVYSVLLKALARMATDNQANLDNLVFIRKAIRRTHDVITVDPSLVPDTVLWNQLMDTYQRAGCFAEVFEIWDALVISRKFDPVSVTIVMDAAGFSGSNEVANNLFKKLHAIGYKFTRKHWTTWIECLCRLGRLNEALRLVCMEMGKDNPSHAPTVDTVQLLLKFAIRTNQEAEVRAKVKHYLPEVWNRLPRDFRLLRGTNKDNFP